MKLNYKKTSGALAATTFAFIGFAVSLQAATLSDQDKQFGEIKKIRTNRKNI